MTGGTVRTLRSLLSLAAALLSLIALAATIPFRGGFAQFSRLYPEASRETVDLTPGKRDLLQRLLAETKFLPHDYPPLGYTGAGSPQDAAIATKAVNSVIETILARPDGPLPAAIVIERIGPAMRPIRLLDTADRDRTIDYMVEIWYMLVFKGATGRFAHGAGFPIPPGYGEPLPPGWTAPDAPRPIP